MVLIQFPFSDASGQKERPAVVISTDIYHNDWDELLVVGLTSILPKTQRSLTISCRTGRRQGYSNLLGRVLIWRRYIES
ncbi:MAG TPA: type II toxin-antitoxin system PemK/MazF family toxin [Blastocatellia bacterium]|nr:type II toxin-antitoxin system PemK/MazF family toxin [Blastocatellia bacterium]